LSFVRLMEIKRIIDESENERVKELFIQSAFTAFQLGVADKMTFSEYLGHLGLSDEPSPHVVTSQSKADDTELLSRMGIKVKKVKK